MPIFRNSKPCCGDNTDSSCCPPSDNSEKSSCCGNTDLDDKKEQAAAVSQPSSSKPKTSMMKQIWKFVYIMTIISAAVVAWKAWSEPLANDNTPQEVSPNE